MMPESACDQEARTLLVSFRNLNRATFAQILYEMEDAVRDCESADLLAPSKTHPVGRLWRVASRGLRDVWCRSLADLARPHPGARPRYEILFVTCNNLGELARLGVAQIRSLCKSARFRACYVSEVWRPSVTSRNYLTELLQFFDVIFLGSYWPVADVEAVTGRPCRYLPPAVDMMLFSPGPRAQARDVDLYYMGRRQPTLHEQFQILAAERGWRYCYDGPALAFPPDAPAHRRFLIDLIQRSRYFVVQPAKINRPDEIQGDQEVGYRFFEGVGTGTVMIGQRPDGPAFARYFDWPGAVLTIPERPEEVRGFFDELDGDPEEVARIRTSNMVNALRAHDVAHRWRSVLEFAGLEPGPLMASRLERLARMVQAIKGTTQAAASDRLVGQVSEANGSPGAGADNPFLDQSSPENGLVPLIKAESPNC